MKRQLKGLVVLFLTLTIPSIANIGPQGFYNHPNKYFVETGTYCGDGVHKALQADFPVIHSLEIDPFLVDQARIRFQYYPQVHIWLKDSSTELVDIIERINAPITFWLDGHNGTPSKDGGKNTPLIEELEQIKQHPIKTHTIMIDDLHCCDTILFDFLSLDDIISKLLEINPDYHFTFEPGGNEGEYETNVLVASP